MKPDYFEAVRNLVSGSISGPTHGPISEYIFNDGQTIPKDAEVKEKLAELEKEYDAKKYQLERLTEYPSIQECVHAILDDNLDALQAKRLKVKAKYPKPN